MSDLDMLHEWLELLPSGRFDDYSGTVAEDFVLRLPFVPPGIPSEFRGREVARDALIRNAGTRGPIVFEDVIVRRTEDPHLFLTTCSGGARMNNGKLYRNDYIMLTRIRDGVVLEHVEYLNPLQVMAAMGD